MADVGHSRSSGTTFKSSDDSRLETTTADNSMKMATRYVTIVILFMVNLLNYMDRSTISGVLDHVEDYYNIGNTEAGYLTSVFIIGFTVFSPVFGFLGDRYNRKYILVGGIACWCILTFASSFIPPQSFWLFLILRGLVGIGEASYCTIAPTIISDMFIKSKRSACLVLFFMAIPVGVGLGYIVGSSVAAATGNWQWALRVTPVLGAVCCLLIIVILKEPPRGMAEHSILTHSDSLSEDIKALLKNKSLLLNTFGYVCVSFTSGAFTLFAPLYIYDGYMELDKSITYTTVTLYFGLVVAAAGVVGIILGWGLAHVAKKRYIGGDAIVCAVSLLLCSLFMLVSIYSLSYAIIITWVFVFLSTTQLSMNWPLGADILLYTVVPTRRSLAEAFMTFFGHLLGDAFSPYLVGVLSDYLHTQKGLSEFSSMKYSLSTCAIAALIGGCLYIACAYYLPKDKGLADAMIHGALEDDGISLDSSGKDREGANELTPLIY